MAQTQPNVLQGRGWILSLKTFLRKQPMMRRVLKSLIPIMLFSIYLFGWRVLSVLVVVTAAGIITEYVFEKTRNQKPTESVLVTCFLYTLILPVTVPYWIAVVGIVFALVFGKLVFGGFGRNVFNPAVLGRVLIFITFPEALTNSWAQPFSGFPGGFADWMPELTDGFSRATPMFLASKGGIGYNTIQLLLGNIPGSMGETSALLIIIAAAYLIIKKTASWKIMLSVFSSIFLTETILALTGVSKFNDPLTAVLSGGVLFGLVFMATDPISSPSNDTARVAYGILTGIVAVIIREFSLFPEGMMFAILIMNSFVPLLDIAAKSLKRRMA